MSRQVVSFTLAGQLFGLPVEAVRDALSGQRPTPIPLAPAEVAGALNLRGQIVTVLDLALRLGLGQQAGEAGKAQVVSQGRGVYGLLVESLGEVLALPDAARAQTPPRLPHRLADCTAGIYQLEAGLLVLLDTARLFEVDPEENTTDPGALS